MSSPGRVRSTPWTASRRASATAVASEFSPDRAGGAALADGCCPRGRPSMRKVGSVSFAFWMWSTVKRTHEAQDDVAVLKLDVEQIGILGLVTDVGLVAPAMRDLCQLTRAAATGWKREAEHATAGHGGTVASLEVVLLGFWDIDKCATFADHCEARVTKAENGLIS
jgi:hypothetical protein